jgi:hypothetical protein
MRRRRVEVTHAHQCRASGCCAQIAHEGARGCPDHWPRFDRPARSDPGAYLEHEAWSRRGGGFAEPQEVEASLYRMGSPARRSPR